MTAPTTAPVQAAPSTDRSAARPATPWWRGLLVALLALGSGLALPFVVRDPYLVGLALDAVLLSLLALSIGFLARHLGLISLGHTAFFGGAAYLVAIATTHWGWAPLPAVLLAVAAATVLAVLMGALVVRASGMGFLMLTLALGQALYQLCVQTSSRPLTGAFDGLQVRWSADSTFLGLAPADVGDAGLFWPIAWTCLVLAGAGLWLLGRSSFGTVLEGIRENEERMRFSGYGTFAPRLLAFVVSGAVAAVGGALFAINANYVSPDLLGFGAAGDSLIATLVGGVGALVGPVLGTGLYVYAQAEFNTSGNLHLYTGVALVLVLVFLPGGIVGAAGRLARRVRRPGGPR